MKIIPAISEEREIRRAYDEKTETWFFSVLDSPKGAFHVSPGQRPGWPPTHQPKALKG